MNYALKEANDKKLDQKYKRDQVLDLQERMDKRIVKLANLKSSAGLNM